MLAPHGIVGAVSGQAALEKCVFLGGRGCKNSLPWDFSPPCVAKPRRRGVVSRGKGFPILTPLGILETLRVETASKQRGFQGEGETKAHHLRQYWCTILPIRLVGLLFSVGWWSFVSIPLHTPDVCRLRSRRLPACSRRH